MLLLTYLKYWTQWLTVITIKTSMLVEGVVEIVNVAALSTEILDHLRSRPVWKAASSCVSCSGLLTSLGPDVS
jgi:hypothetical protein